MSNLKITVKLALGFVLVLLVFALTSGTSMVMTTRIAVASADNGTGSDVLNGVDDAVEGALTSLNHVRNHMLMPTPSDGEMYNKDVTTVADALAKAKARAADYRKGSDAAAQLDRLAAAFAHWRIVVGDKIAGTDMSGSGALDSTIAIIKSDSAKAARAALFSTVAEFKKQLNDWSNEDQASEDAAVAQLRLLQTAGLAIAAVVSALIAWSLSRAIARPIGQMTGAMAALAAGDVQLTVPALGRRDEVGQMAEAVQVFKDAAIAKSRLGAEAAEARQRAEADRVRVEAERAHAAEKQAAVVDSVAKGLAQLADGNLLFRLQTSFAAEYEQLRTDFNKAVDKLFETMKEVAANTAAIRSGSSEIASAADDLSRRTEQQAASLEETAAALDEITATVKKTSEGAGHARQVVSNAKADAERSGQVVAQAVEAMSAIEKSSQQVSQIIGVIDEIAFQTNLLALNAGVEAARAGEAGRGFAVVASEVRALAQRSAEAAKEIKTLISASTDQVSQGVALVAQTGKSLGQIVEQVAEITTIMSDIAVSAQEQATGLDQVNTAVNQMDQVTQQNAAMVEQSTAASHSLTSEAEELSRLIGRFQIGDADLAKPAAKRTPSVKRVAAPVKALKATGSGGAARKIEAAAEEAGWAEF